MNRTRLFSACLLGLGALTVLAAQDATVTYPGAAAGSPAAPAAAAAAAPAPTFTEPQVLQMYGWILGKQRGLFELGFSADQIAIVLNGLQAAAAGKPAPYNPDQIVPQVEAYMQKRQEAYLAKLRDTNLAETKAFFEKLKENKNAIELPDGLRYEIVKQGTGAFPKVTDTVKVHYTGKLLNGTVIDSSVERGEPVEFPLNQVIPGWTEGLQKINQGGKIRLYIPPQLAYGDSGQQAVPPGATLIFDIELLEVKATPPAAPALAPAPKP